MELQYEGRRYPAENGVLALGASPDAGVVLAGAAWEHALVEVTGTRMATIRRCAAAEVHLNGIPLGPDPSPLMHGDIIRIGAHELTVIDPTHAPGEPESPPPGARERLHDTMYGLPGVPTPPSSPPASVSPPPEPRRAGGRFWIIVAALLSLALIGYLLLS